MKNEVHYGHYLVCMMDLLGQKEMYKKLESFELGEGNSELKELIINFIKSIEFFKNDVDSYFTGIEKTTLLT